MVVEKIQSALREYDVRVKRWMARQSLPVEVAVVTASSAAQGGFIGAMMGTLTGDLSAAVQQTTAAGANSAEAAASVKQMQALSGGPLVQARNFAIMTGVNAGLTCALKRARGGVEDIQSNMLAAFGSGLAFSLVSGVASPNAAGSALSTGVAFAVVQGGLFQVGKMFSTQTGDDHLYSEGKSMLTQLGLQKYEKNFRKGLLTDSTLPLINDSALQEVKIPAGPRLLILDHISRSQTA